MSPYKDPDMQKKAQREIMRRRRRGTSVGKQLDSKWLKFHLQSTEDLRQVAEEQIEIVRNSGADELVVAKTINQLLQTSIKLLELSELEDRVAEIEADEEGKATESFKDAKVQARRRSRT
jgi:hypothetical protein